MNKFIVLACMAVMVFAIPSAHAVATLELSSGATTITVADGSIGDLNPIAGVVTFIGPIGGYDLNVTTGVTYPYLGSPSVPHMDLNSIDAASGVGTLTIKYSEINYTGLPGGAFLTVGGTLEAPAGSSLLLQAFYDNGNGLFADTTLIGALGPFTTAEFSGQGSFGFNPTAPYSLTLESTLNLTGAGSTSYNFHMAPVPEPGTMMLLGSGLVGLAGWGRKKFRK